MLYDISILTKISSCMEKKLQKLIATSELCEQQGQFVPHGEGTQRKKKVSCVRQF